MCKLSKLVAKTLVEKLSVMASGELKVTFTLFAKKSGENYISQARITDKSEQLQLSFLTPVEKEETPVRFSVEAQKFVDVLNSLLSFDKDINMNIEEGSKLSLGIEGTATLLIPTVEATEELPFTRENAISLVVEGKAFNTLFRKGGFAVDKNSSRPMCKAATFMGVLADKKLEVSSSDGQLIAYASATASNASAQEGAGETFKAAIPESALTKMLKLTSGAQSVNIMLTATQMVVAAGTSMFLFTLANESMDVSKFMAQWSALSLNEGVTVDAEAILNAINVLTVADEKTKAYLLNVGETFEMATVSTKQSVAISLSEKLDDFSNKEVGISKPYLEKIVKNLNKGNVTIRTSATVQTPFVFTNGTCSEPSVNSVCYIMKCNLKQAAPKEE